MISFDKHTATICAKTNRTGGIIKYKFYKISVDTFQFFSGSLVKAMLFMGLRVYTKVSTRKFYEIHYRATKIADNFKDITQDSHTSI